MLDLFSMVTEDSERFNEKNDCAVKAVALATGKPYADVRARMMRIGRRPKKGTPIWVTEAVLREYGYKMVLETRFPHARTPITAARTMPKRGVYLIRTRRHILCYRAGKIQDWTDGRRHRITAIWKIVRL